MKKNEKMTPKGIALLIALVALICLAAVGCGQASEILEVLSREEYTYVNPDESKAETDEGFVIDGVLDEQAYRNNNWLYLHNDDGGNNVDIAMTSYYGEKGMYFVYDVTESVPIYVNLSRASYMNSCIEMYFAPSTVTSLKENSVFEVDLLPTGDMVFKKNNGKGGYVNVSTTDDIMAYLGATTKGGAVNTEDCYGYCLELFIPWEYMEWLGMDAEAMKTSFVYVDPAHITSHNLTGTDSGVDRYWYFYAQQQGAGFGDVYQYFRFDGTGVLGTVPVTLSEGEHYTITGDKNVIPGMQTLVTITPEAGYALNSILVNGEEYIGKAAYSADGSVTLTLRAGKDGLTVSAAAEAVTEGSKTLSGTVALHKMGGDTLEGVLVTYTGPQGEKPITLDSDGKFRLTDLAQGSYVLTVEKEGYTTISRSICLNRDIHAELALEYDMFFVEKGTAWVLDRQNDGMLDKFGGSGYLLTNDSYNDFTFETYIRYDEELAKAADTDNFVQQRSGMRILFSNGKYWHIDLLNEGGKYRVQYARHSGDGSLFGKWINLCTMNADQIAKYKSEEGIRLTVVRKANYAAVYLEDKLLGVERLDQEYAGLTAQLGFESWIANQEIMEVPYSISDEAIVDVTQSYFLKPNGWDITGQYNGYVGLLSGGRGNLEFANMAANFDLTLTVQDADDPGNTFARNDVLLVFDNGAHVSFGITSDENGAWIQSLNNAANDGKEIYKRFAHHGALTAEEYARYKNGGVEFRIVRIGTEVSLYVDGRLVNVCDLTNNDRGVTEGMTAKVTLRHYDDAGVYIQMPVRMTAVLKQVKVTCVESEYGTVAANKQHYIVGDTVVLSDSGEGDHYCVGMKVNGEKVTLDETGTYSFLAEEGEYVVEGEFAPRIFKDSAEWNEFRQNDGILSIPNSDGDSGWIESWSKDYKDFDLKLTLRDQRNADDNYRAAVRLAFSNGEYVTFTLTNDRSNSDASTVYELQNMGGSLYGWKFTGYTLSEAQAAKLLSEEGLEFRVVRSGDVADLYVGGEHAYEFDLSVNGSVKDLTTNIQFRFYGNKGQDVTLPFTITDAPETVKVTSEPCQNGSIVTDQLNYYPGDPVVISVKGDSGYYYSELKVNGKSVILNADGHYSFTAKEAAYTVAAAFAEGVFVDYNGNTWNLINQNHGLLHISSANNGAGWMQTKGNYNELSLTVKDYSGGATKDYAVVAQLYFSNGKYVSIRLIDEKDNGTYKLMSMGDSVFKWATHHTLNDAQKAKLLGNGIVFRMTRIGTTLNLYLDDVLVKKLDLTGNGSGITADMTCVAKVRYYNSKGYDVTMPFTLGNPEQKVTVNVENAANGTVTTDKTGYLVGDTVVLTAQGNSGYCLSALYVDGKAVEFGSGGTCSFVATRDTYNISAAFVPAVWRSAYSWDTTWQSKGILVSPASTGDTGWMDTYANSYRDVSLTVTDHTPGAKDFRMGVHMAFTNGKIFRISLTNADSGEPGVYKIQTMGSNSIVGNWKTHYRLTDAEVAKIQGSGLNFRVSIVGTDAVIYLDGIKVCVIDLSAGIDADTKAMVTIRQYGNKGTEAKIPFTVGDASDLVIVKVADTANGTVTADKTSCKLGDTVTLTVKGDEGFYHTGLYVNGQPVKVGTDGTYTFTATANSYNVTCGFAEGVFKEGNLNWNLTNQNVGLLSVPDTVTGNTGWMDTKGNWNELSVTVKDYSGGTKHEYAVVSGLYFSNGKYVSIRLISNANNGTYALQSMGDSVFGWATHHTLTDAQKAKVQGEGIVFTMSRRGTLLDLYLDGELIKTLDLTGKSSGITPGMTCIARVRYYNFGYAAELPFTLGNPDQTVQLNITANNGSVTTDKETYLVGETVQLTVKGDEGYFYSGVTVGGKAVTLDWNGNYSFVATENSYDVTAVFAPTNFSGGDTRHWRLFKQHVGELMVASHASGHSGWIDGIPTSNDVTTVVKDHTPDANNFAMIYMFKFSNGETFYVRMNHTDKDGVYRIQSMNSTLFAAWKSRHDFTAEETASIKGDGIKFRVIILDKTAYIYLNDVQVCTYDLTSTGKGDGLENATVNVTLRMDGNLNNDVYMTYKLANTTTLP